MLRFQVVQLDQPWLPAWSTALSAAAHFTVCCPIPLTGTCALAPGYHRAGAVSTAQSRPAIPEGDPPPVAVTYCTPAVDGASVGPDSETVGWLLSMYTVFVYAGSGVETPAASVPRIVSATGP